MADTLVWVQRVRVMCRFSIWQMGMWYTLWVCPCVYLVSLPIFSLQCIRLPPTSKLRVSANCGFQTPRGEKQRHSRFLAPPATISGTILFSTCFRPGSLSITRPRSCLCRYLFMASRCPPCPHVFQPRRASNVDVGQPGVWLKIRVKMG